MEECFGGELFERIWKRIQANDMYTEKGVCSLIRQIIGTIEYCHNNGIVHRDLKPENLLFLNEGNEENNPIKIVDFGLSQYINLRQSLNSKVGSSLYVSPEVLAGNYNEKCDIWSAGIIIYILLSGEPPFYGPNDDTIYAKIKSLKYTFPEEKWKNISKEAKDLISNMLIKQEKRFSASQVLQHPWFNLIKDEKLNLNKLNFGKKNFFQEYKIVIN
jgi:calcium-dependent protein kinase